MDLLSKVNMSTKIILGIGILLVAGLVVVVLQKTQEIKPLPMTESKSPVNPTAPEPSKENVSKQVHEEALRCKVGN
jgi:hypothetical protein